ncbi:MAG: DUF859 family phage minor structural protein, partial [Turicibacter sp.]|nr:DUF859 family phage minor structural protein [Turicibacter sp.]
ATSGTQTIPVVAGQLNLVFNWNRTSVNVPTNRSTIIWEVLLVSTATAVELVSTQNTNINVQIEGNTVLNGSIQVGILPNMTRTLATGANINIPHEADGTKTFSWNLSCQFDVTYQATPLTTITASGSGVLDPIPRATQATLTGNPCTFGNSLTINLPRQSTAFTHVITYIFGNLSGTLTTTATNSFVWTPPMTMTSEIAFGTSGTGVLTVVTMDGADVIGVVRLNFTLEIGSRPPVLSAIQLTQATTDIATQFGANVYVQLYSRLRIRLTATAQANATIKWIKIKVNGQELDGSSGATVINANVVTDRLITSGANPVEITVTDSRGLQTTWTGGITVTAYNFPNISIDSVQRVTAGNVLDDNGTRMRITYDFSVTNIGGNNTPVINARTRQASGTWATQNGIQSGAFSGNNVQYLHPATFSINYGYEIELTITDWFSRNGYRTATTSNLSYLNTPFVLMDWNNSGKGMAFGGYSSLIDRVHGLETMPWQFQEGAIYAGRGATPVNGVQNVPATTDVDTLVNTGVYWLAGASANRPIAQTGWLNVFSSSEANRASTIVKQIWWAYSGSHSVIYVRRRDGASAWTAWQRIDATSHFFNATLTGNNLYFYDVNGTQVDVVDLSSFVRSLRYNDTDETLEYRNTTAGTAGVIGTVDMNPFLWRVNRVSTGVDLNNYVTTNIYYFTNITSNRPSLYRHGAVTSGWMMVLEDRRESGVDIKQIFYTHGAGTDTVADGTQWHTFVRSRIGGTWMSWVNLMDTREHVLANGQNLNTLRTTGVYVANNDGLGNSTTNRPQNIQGAYHLEVKQTWASDGTSWDGCIQTYYHYWNPAGGAFTRLWDGTSWTPWKKQFDSEDDTGWQQLALTADFVENTALTGSGAWYRVKCGVLYVRLVRVDAVWVTSGTTYLVATLPTNYYIQTLTKTLPNVERNEFLGVTGDSSFCRITVNNRNIQVLYFQNSNQWFSGSVAIPLNSF